MKTTLKSLGCTGYSLLQSNLNDHNKRVIIIADKEEWTMNLVCSQELSEKIRSGKQSVMKKLWNTAIGNGLELEAYQ
jgi:hypothetical protein